MSSGEVCTYKTARGQVVNPLPKYHRSSTEEEGAGRGAERSVRFSTTAQWTAPTAQRSHLGRSRVSLCASESGAASPYLTHRLSPDAVTREGGEGGVSRSRQYKQPHEGTLTGGMRNESALD